jgi:hypothetical protein
MALCAFVWFIPPAPKQELGICFYTAESWGLNPWLSWGVNLLLVWLMAMTLSVLNRRFNFITSPSQLFVYAFLVMCGAHPLLSHGLNTATLLAVANLICIGTLFSQYGQRTSSRGIFLIASTLAWGSMIQYSFLFFIPVYVLCAISLKVFGWKELGALVMGIIAPYWIVLGFGIVSPDQFYIPHISNIWNTFSGQPESVIIILLSGITALWVLLLGLKNTLSLFNANTATRAYSHCIAIPGFAIILFMMLDYGNFVAYYTSLCLIAAVQLGYLTAYGPRKPSLIPYIIHFALYMTLFILTLYYGS